MTTPNFKAWAERWDIHPQAVAELALMIQPIEHTSPSSSEQATQQAIRLESFKHGNAMWRNNNGACFDDTGRMIRYGVGNDSKQINEKWKSGDLIGIQGSTGRLVMCEVKRPDWRAPENDRDIAQQNALTQVNALGGIGFFATHVDDYRRNVCS